MTRGFGAISLLALGFVQTFAAGQTAAQETGGAAQANPCAHAVNDEEMRACRTAELQRSEADLAAIVDKLNASYVGDERTPALKAANDAWLRFRDAECALLTIDSASGTMYDVYLAACLTGKNVERIAQMQWLVDHP